MTWGFYTPTHIISLFVGALIIVGLYFALKKRSDRVKIAVLFVLSFSGTAAVIYNLVTWGSPLEYLPLHLCSISAAVLPFAVITRNKVLNNLLLLWSFGALFALLVNTAVAEASIFSALPSIILYSQYAYAQNTDDGAVDDILKRFSGISLEEYCALDLNFFEGCREEPYLFGTLPKILLYNDPLSPFYDGILQNYDITSKIEEYAARLRSVEGGSERDKKEFEILAQLCDVLTIKWNLGIRVRSAYQQKAFSFLKYIVDNDIPLLISRLLEFKSLFCERWLSENKTNGFGTQDLRIGGVVERLRTVQLLINSYLNGEIDRIDELEEELLPQDENSTLDMLLWTTWKRIHTLYV